MSFNFLIWSHFTFSPGRLGIYLCSGKLCGGNTGPGQNLGRHCMPAIDSTNAPKTTRTLQAFNIIEFRVVLLKTGFI